eukprot:EG_transcript_35728
MLFLKGILVQLGGFVNALVRQSFVCALSPVYVISDIDQNLVPACKESHVKVDLEALRHIGLQSYLCGKPLSNEHLLPGPSQVRYLRGRSGILKAISVQPADPVLAEVPA